MLDLLLAIAHHLLVFALVGLMVAERALLRSARIDPAIVARVDAGFGGVAGLVLLVGVIRAVWGARGFAFYEANPFFWGKIAAFVAIGLLSIGPTLRFLSWRRAARADAAFNPPAAEVAKARRLVDLELLLLIPLLACAAAMARWPL